MGTHSSGRGFRLRLDRSANPPKESTTPNLHDLLQGPTQTLLRHVGPPCNATEEEVKARQFPVGKRNWTTSCLLAPRVRRAPHKPDIDTRKPYY